MTTIHEELAAHTSNVQKRIGVDAYANLVNGQVGEARVIAEGALRTGQQVPEFELPDAEGKLVTLASRLEQGPVVLTFYRGGWCPYCNIALRALQSCLSEIKQHGAGLIAISPELPDQSLSTREKLHLGFDVLSDRDNFVARQFGLVYRVSDAARQRLLGLGRDLVAHNGNESWELPITGTYVIHPNRVIAFDHIDADYRNRLDPALIVNVLRK